MSPSLPTLAAEPPAQNPMQREKLPGKKEGADQGSFETAFQEKMKVNSDKPLTQDQASISQPKEKKSADAEKSEATESEQPTFQENLSDACTVLGIAPPVYAWQEAVEPDASQESDLASSSAPCVSAQALALMPDIETENNLADTPQPLTLEVGLPFQENPILAQKTISSAQAGTGNAIVAGMSFEQTSPEPQAVLEKDGATLPAQARAVSPDFLAQWASGLVEEPLELASNTQLAEAVQAAMKEPATATPRRLQIQLATPYGATVSLSLFHQNGEIRAQLGSSNQEALAWLGEQIKSWTHTSQGQAIRWLPLQLEAARQDSTARSDFKDARKRTASNTQKNSQITELLETESDNDSGGRPTIQERKKL